MATRASSAFIASIVVLVATGFAGSAAETSHRIWKSTGIDDYRWIATMNGFCACGGIDATITDGRVVHVSYLDPNGDPISDPTTYEGGLDVFPPLTIDGMFRLLEREDYDVAQVEYDRDLGYPRAIWIDFARNASDDEFEYTARLLPAEHSGS